MIMMMLLPNVPFCVCADRTVSNGFSRCALCTDQQTDPSMSPVPPTHGHKKLPIYERARLKFKWSIDRHMSRITDAFVCCSFRSVSCPQHVRFCQIPHRPHNAICQRIYLCKHSMNSSRHKHMNKHTTCGHMYSDVALRGKCVCRCRHDLWPFEWPHNTHTCTNMC